MRQLDHVSASASPVSVSQSGLIRLSGPARAIALDVLRVRSLQTGAYVSHFRGRGMEFDESRPYQPGDDGLSALVRPYTLTGGRTRPRGGAVPVEAIVCRRGGWRRHDPHLAPVEAEIYLGWADNDAVAPPEQVPVMEQALTDAGVDYTLDFFTDAQHGYAPPHGERYNREASEMHWERVHSMFRRRLW